jgi:hypothetical protein
MSACDLLEQHFTSYALELLKKENFESHIQEKPGTTLFEWKIYSAFMTGLIAQGDRVVLDNISKISSLMSKHCNYWNLEVIDRVEEMPFRKRYDTPRMTYLVFVGELMAFFQTNMYKIRKHPDRFLETFFANTIII